ncbi:MAG TPA: NAD-dependent malic enzyme [Acidobacteriota bacterium]|nr:NAD-dependent malic enzyme [Acidobacteriota bacterium]
MSEELPSATVAAPSPQYSITVRLECPHSPGWIARISGVVAQQGGSIEAIDLVHIHKQRSLRDYTIECGSAEQEEQMIEALKRIEGITVHSVSDDTFLLHLGGKLEVTSRVQLNTRADLSMAYTPGVARVCTSINKDPRTSFNLTIRKNCIAVVSDGSAVLGLGNIGPEAAMPVMEGKAILFKEFGGVDAFPLCIDTQETEEIIRFCQLIAPTFGGINLEDISAPRCFEIEQRLTEELEIPVFHDDQHGTAVVVLAALINTLKLTGRKAGSLKLVISGAGASAYQCCRTLAEFGVENIVVCDSRGAIHQGREFGDNPAKTWLARNTNPQRLTGSLQEALAGADMFLGLSAPGLLKREDVLRMNPDPIIFAMANPTPEIMPEEVEGAAAVIATGRSDYVNQINNVLAFPGIFRGALDARASRINQEMKQAAALAIAGVITDEELSRDYIIPSAFNRKVYKQVAAAVAKAAHRSGVAHRMPKGINLRA